MVNLSCADPYQLWAELTKHCLAHGIPNVDEQVEILELVGVSFCIEFPDRIDETIKKHCDPLMIESMVKNLNTFEPQFGYKISYGERIFGKPDASAFSNVQSLLMRKPESKSATICLIKEDDVLKGHVPCIAAIDFKIRNDRLNLFYFARSQDVFKKSYADNLALAHLQRRLASELNVKGGSISGFIASAHLYKSDLPKISYMQLFGS